MPEDVDEVTGQPEVSTETPESQDPETLAPETDDPASSPDELKPEKPEEPVFDPEMEQTIEFNGKTYSFKGAELEKILGNAQVLAEKEKSLNRDYTQKTQALAEQRKSIEEAFGRVPEKSELQALGKVWKAYFDNPQVQEVVNAIIQGQPLPGIESSETADDPQSKIINDLNRKISQLEGRLSQFVSGSEQEKIEQAEMEGKRIFDSWMDSKKKSGVTIAEDQIDPILKWAGFLKQSNPTMDSQSALEEAYRHVNIDSLDKQATNKVLKKADDAKKKASIKITPKTPSKQESQSYADIFKDAM